MRLDKFLTSVLVRIDPSYQKYVRKDGTCIVRLKRALYGCIESAKMWYDKLSSDLRQLDYAVNKHDICVFNRIEKDGSQSTICIFVDDLLVTAKSENIIDNLIQQLSPLVKNINDAAVIVPLIKEYLDVGVKNDEQLIKMTSVVQRLLASDAKQKADQPADWILSPDELKQIQSDLKGISQINKDIEESLSKTIK